MKPVLQFAILLALGFSTALTAQPRPDFSGSWLEDESQRKTPYATTGGVGVKAVSGKDVPIVITQTPETIVIARNFIEHVKHLHHFDGREEKNRNGAQVHTTRTRWDGARLVTEGTTFQSTSQGESYWKLKEVRSLTPKGELVVETTRTDEDGDAKTVRQVYKRAR